MLEKQGYRMFSRLYWSVWKIKVKIIEQEEGGEGVKGGKERRASEQLYQNNKRRDI